MAGSQALSHKSQQLAHEPPHPDSDRARGDHHRFTGAAAAPGVPAIFAHPNSVIRTGRFLLVLSALDRRHAAEFSLWQASLGSILRLLLFLAIARCDSRSVCANLLV